MNTATINRTTFTGVNVITLLMHIIVNQEYMIHNNFNRCTAKLFYSYDTLEGKSPRIEQLSFSIYRDRNRSHPLSVSDIIIIKTHTEYILQI